MNRLSARALIAALTLSVLMPFAAAQTQQPGYGTPPPGTTTTGTTTTSTTPTPNTGVP